MSKLIIFRHAQASFGSQNYDQLSDLGHQQSLWLGQHLNQFENRPDRLLAGTLTRHQQTAQGILTGLDSQLAIDQDQCWNEFEFEVIIKAYLKQHPEATPKDKKPSSFFSLLKKVMIDWSEDKVALNGAESWKTFESRVMGAFETLQQMPEQETVWLVTSGGVIAMLLSHILEANKKTMIDLNLQTRNTSMSEVIYKQKSQSLMAFNQIPHLASHDKIHAVTYA